MIFETFAFCPSEKDIFAPRGMSLENELKPNKSE